MLSSLIEDWARGIARMVARLFANSPLTPNSLTVIGMLLNFPVAYVLSNGWFFWGGLLMLFAGVFDMLDGALAKVTGKATKYGAFLDSVLDRYGEIICYLGLLLYFRSSTEADKDGGSILVYAAITGSLMISYAKARAEGLGMECKTGMLPRPERVVLTALGSLFMPLWSGSLLLVLWILAIGTNLTAFQRIIYIWLQTERQKKAEASAAANKIDPVEAKKREKGPEEESRDAIRNPRTIHRPN